MCFMLWCGFRWMFEVCCLYVYCSSQLMMCMMCWLLVLMLLVWFSFISCLKLGRVLLDLLWILLCVLCIEWVMLQNFIVQWCRFSGLIIVSLIWCWVRCWRLCSYFCVSGLLVVISICLVFIVSGRKWCWCVQVWEIRVVIEDILIWVGLICRQCVLVCVVSYLVRCFRFSLLLLAVVSLRLVSSISGWILLVLCVFWVEKWMCFRLLLVIRLLVISVVVIWLKLSWFGSSGVVVFGLGMNEIGGC